MKQAVDERVAGGICHLSARAFWLMLAVQAVVLVGKLALGYAVVWGLLIFFAMVLLLRLGEYSADVRVQTAEAAQEGAADEE